MTSSASSQSVTIEDEIVLQVLVAISAFQPIRVPAIASLLQSTNQEVRQATRLLEQKRFIHGRGNRRLFATARGQLAVRRADAAKLRDMSRLLYLWRQHREGRR